MPITGYDNYHSITFRGLTRVLLYGIQDHHHGLSALLECMQLVQHLACSSLGAVQLPRFCLESPFSNVSGMLAQPKIGCPLRLVDVAIYVFHACSYLWNILPGMGSWDMHGVYENGCC